MGEKSRMLMFCLVLGILVSPSHQLVTTLIPIGLKYTFFFTTYVTNRSFPKYYIQHYLASLWTKKKTLPDVGSTGGDYQVHPPHQQLNLLHTWMCHHHVFKAKQSRKS
ncbi:hypothetical protein GOBAR_AA09015 [Gossypium barbadense]|uniref:Uncharacterized protein n=1 Tax=Gossypium barbadense TaxID=3634 RepID=A0A2P5Y7T8_GOSBA|nr:hypothetical protein GOBAR_AA09015 [Gossypium barbadense]